MYVASSTAKSVVAFNLAAASRTAIADEIAGAADLARGKAEGVPAVIVRGLTLRGDGSGLYFEVGIRAPGAAPAAVTVDEYLKDYRRERGGLWFETSQVWTWPNRECGTSWHAYRLVEGDGSTNLEFTWRYILPGLAGAQVFNALRFSRSIERAGQIYVDRLARRVGQVAVTA